ncbi:MAG: PKD-like domain-containing protein, partial [Bacteroidota bacterium]
MKRIVLLILLVSLFNLAKGQTYNLPTCTGIAFSFSVSSEPVGTTYTWSAPSGTGFTGGSNQTIGQLILTGTLTNITDNFVDATYVIATSTGNSYTLVVTITPIPKIDPIPDQAAVCPYFFSTPLVPLSGPTPNTLYFWSYSGISNGLPLSGTDPNRIPTYQALNPTSSLLQSTISVVPTINGCQGIPTSFKMLVKPMPDITNNPNINLCNGVASAQIDLSSNIPNALITWTNNNPSIGLDPSGTGSIASFTPINTGFGPVTAIVQVTGFSNGCYGLNEPFQITVNPIPEMTTISPNNSSICGGLTPTFTFQSPFYPGTVFNWTNSNTANGLPANGTGQINGLFATNFNVIPINSIITVTPSLNGCTGTPQTLTLEVKPTPQVSPVGNITICANGTIGPINFTGSIIPDTEYQWSHTNTDIGLLASSGSGSIPAFSATNVGGIPITSIFTVRPFTNTCFGPSTSFSVRVNPIPRVIQVADQSKCEFLIADPVTFSGIVPNTIFNWSNDNIGIGLGAAGTGNIGTFTFANPTPNDITGTITVTPISNTCVGPTMSYSYTAKAAPDVVQPFSQTKCNGTLTDQVIFSSTAMPGAIFNWTRTNVLVGSLPLSGTGNINVFTATNINATPIQTAITVTPFSNSCFGQPRTFTIVINPTPSVTVSSGSGIVICSGFSTSVNFSGSSVASTQYNWTNDNNAIGLGFSGTGSITPFVTSNSSNLPIIANLVVTPISNSCQGTPVAFSICVKPTPTMNAVANTTICSGAITNAITFTGSVLSGIQYNWIQTNVNIGLAAISGTGNVPAFTSTNNFGIPITSVFSVTPFTNGCNGTVRTFNITVNPTPTIGTISDRVVCTGVNVSTPFIGTTVANTTFTWTNDNAAIGAPANGSGSSLAFTSTNASPVPISGRLTVTPISNSCSGLPTVFSVLVNPSVAVNAIPNQVRCNGTLTNNIAFTGSPVANTIYSWTNTNIATGLTALSGTGNIMAFTTNSSFFVPVVSVITVTPMSNSCSGTSRSFSILVNPIPTVTPNSNLTFCNGNAANLTFSGSNVPGTIYQWTNSQNIGLAPSGSTAINTFTATNLSNIPVTSLITVTPVSNACSGLPNSFTVTVNPIPNILPVADQRICHNTSTAPINFSGSNIAGTVYNWTRTNVPFGSLPLSGTGNIASFSAVNLGNTPVTAIFTVVPVSNTCSGNPITFSITISPLPTVEPVASINLCGGQPTGNINFTDFNIVGTQ